MHLGLYWRALCAPNHNHESPAALPKLQMAPRPKLFISLGSKKKESRCMFLSEDQASHSHRTWAEVSSFTPQPLQAGLLVKRSRKRCLLRVLWPVRRPVTTLAWVLVKDKSLALLPRLGPEINSRACLRVLLRPLQLALCWLFNQRQCLFCISRLYTPKTDSGPRKPRPEPFLASPSAISFPAIQHAQGPNIVAPHVGQRCHSSPFDTDGPKETSFWLPKVFSVLLDYQSIYLRISLIYLKSVFHIHRQEWLTFRPGRLLHIFRERNWAFS
jgi:hypothetical protein